MSVTTGSTSSGASYFAVETLAVPGTPYSIFRSQRGSLSRCTQEDGLVGGSQPLPSLALQACEGRAATSLIAWSYCLLCHRVMGSEHVWESSECLARHSRLKRPGDSWPLPAAVCLVLSDSARYRRRFWPDFRPPCLAERLGRPTCFLSPTAGWKPLAWPQPPAGADPPFPEPLHAPAVAGHSRP